MDIYLRSILGNKNKRKLLVGALSLIAIIGIFSFVRGKIDSGKSQEDSFLGLSRIIILQGNSLAPVSEPNSPPPKAIGEIEALLTAYSSTPEETDADPFVTAAGTPVRDGIIANNILPFGTKVRIPEIYGDKIFIVEDRMHSRKGDYQFDIWFAETQEAKDFGVKLAIIEILEN